MYLARILSIIISLSSAADREYFRPVSRLIVSVPEACVGIFFEDCNCEKLSAAYKNGKCTLDAGKAWPPAQAMLDVVQSKVADTNIRKGQAPSRQDWKKIKFRYFLPKIKPGTVHPNTEARLTVADSEYCSAKREEIEGRLYSRTFNAFYNRLSSNEQRKVDRCTRQGEGWVPASKLEPFKPDPTNQDSDSFPRGGIVGKGLLDAPISSIKAWWNGKDKQTRNQEHGEVPDVLSRKGGVKVPPAKGSNKKAECAVGAKSPLAQLRELTRHASTVPEATRRFIHENSGQCLIRPEQYTKVFKEKLTAQATVEALRAKLKKEGRKQFNAEERKQIANAKKAAADFAGGINGYDHFFRKNFLEKNKNLRIPSNLKIAGQTPTVADLEVINGVASTIYAEAQGCQFRLAEANKFFENDPEIDRSDFYFPGHFESVARIMACREKAGAERWPIASVGMRSDNPGAKLHPLSQVISADQQYSNWNPCYGKYEYEFEGKSIKRDPRTNDRVKDLNCKTPNGALTQSLCPRTKENFPNEASDADDFLWEDALNLAIDLFSKPEDFRKYYKWSGLESDVDDICYYTHKVDMPKKNKLHELQNVNKIDGLKIQRWRKGCNLRLWEPDDIAKMRPPSENRKPAARK